MTFFLHSKRPDEKTAYISFSGSHISKFGFHPGSKVSVDISKGQIIIRLIEPFDHGVDTEIIDIDCVERKNLYEDDY